MSQTIPMDILYLICVGAQAFGHFKACCTWSFG